MLFRQIGYPYRGNTTYHTQCQSASNHHCYLPSLPQCCFAVLLTIFPPTDLPAHQTWTLAFYTQVSVVSKSHYPVRNYRPLSVSYRPTSLCRGIGKNTYKLPMLSVKLIKSTVIAALWYRMSHYNGDNFHIPICKISLELRRYWVVEEIIAVKNGTIVSDNHWLDWRFNGEYWR